MTKKRFRKGYVLGDTGLIDEEGELKWFIENINSVSDLEKNWDKVIDKLNEVAEEKGILEVQLRSSENEIDKLMAEINMLTDTCHDCCKEIREENKELKHHIKELEKELHLAHMRAMFSTVKSFKGDVSKRYKYSEETDTLYDTANTYGQYDKILDKKEVVMLLNEYETLLNERDLNE